MLRAALVPLLDPPSSPPSPPPAGPCGAVHRGGARPPGGPCPPPRATQEPHPGLQGAPGPGPGRLGGVGGGAGYPETQIPSLCSMCYVLEGLDRMDTDPPAVGPGPAPSALHWEERGAQFGALNEFATRFPRPGPGPPIPPGCSV